MKRFFSCVICVLLLLSFLAGCKKEPEYYSEWISVYESLPAESEETVSADDSSSAELLSAEDKALKAEIAKVSDTKVDFRANKNQSFCGKDYNLSYKQINTLFTDKGTEKIDYMGKTEDGYDAKFTYNLKDGKLFLAEFGVPKVQKQTDSISLSHAEKIAAKFALEFCDLKKYNLSFSREMNDYYMIAFANDTLGYETDDEIILQIDFNGNLIFLRDNTGIFEGMNFSVDETKLIPELENELNDTFPNNAGYTIKKKRLGVLENNPAMNYTVSIDTGEYSMATTIAIPIK
ncbi:MAG: hypothetical protein IJZ75_04695 [Clostridia bacterium]|nr:hypothetical protein [Clostridia bacterium]